GGREVDLSFVDGDAAREHIDHQASGGDDRLVVAARLITPKRGANARQQLFGTKRLGDVVVRASVQRLDLLVLVHARREHQDRDATPVAQPPTYFDAVHARQGKVQ